MLCNRFLCPLLNDCDDNDKKDFKDDNRITNCNYINAHPSETGTDQWRADFAAELIAWARTKMAGYQTPKKIRFVDLVMLSCPCTASSVSDLYCLIERSSKAVKLIMYSYCTAPYRTELCTVLHCTVLYCIVLLCTALLYAVLHRTVQYRIVLYQSVLHHVILFQQYTTLYRTEYTVTRHRPEVITMSPHSSSTV